MMFMMIVRGYGGQRVLASFYPRFMHGIHGVIPVLSTVRD